jgi:hypothetical protein
LQRKDDTAWAGAWSGHEGAAVALGCCATACSVARWSHHEGGTAWAGCVVRPRGGGVTLGCCGGGRARGGVVQRADLGAQSRSYNRAVVGARWPLSRVQAQRLRPAGAGLTRPRLQTRAGCANEQKISRLLSLPCVGRPARAVVGRLPVSVLAYQRDVTRCCRFELLPCLFLYRSQLSSVVVR